MEEKTTLMEKLGKVVNIAANAIMMNVLFLLACAPIVTIGAAWNALFSAVRYSIRGDRWFEGFKFGFKTRFWRSLLSWVLMMIPVLWVLEYDVIGVLLDETGAFRTLAPGNIVLLVFACVMFLMLSGMLAAMTLLNVYIPTKVGNWISTAANMVFKYPLQLAITGLLMWFPWIMVQLWPTYFYILVMVFVVAYFILSGYVITMVMKQPLLDCLMTAREEGTLLTEQEEEESEERSEENA